MSDKAHVIKIWVAFIVMMVFLYVSIVITS
ncbi:hypothetical protein SAMN05421807_112127 [Virgibacillus chiguensis]|uniref:Uncharacterized protein n=1 Tax=Virgibacillus chiguensis TaxID=411959 RepID=A0A1M5VHM2_9BACI|nr:hypothetical protein SAMN05421807_112127 [Virgibacillus chiguensis]